MRPVLIILDMAKGYGWHPGSLGYYLVSRIKKLKDAAYRANIQVIHVNSLRRKTDGLSEASTMLEGTDAIEVIPELQPVDKDILIYKRYLSGFSHNDLDYTLRTLHCDTVIIAGASTDNTVLWTAADAYQNRYKVIVVEDCTIVHRPNEPPEVKEYALRIIKNVLHSEVLKMDILISRYLKPSP